MKIFRYIILILLLASPVFGTTYTAYFSNAVTGNATGTDTPVALSDCDGSDAANTCSTLAHAQTYLDLATDADTVTLYFDRADTWTMNTLLKTATHGLIIQSDDPIVNIDAYGTGADPIFDGSITDFAAAPEHNATTGPLRWSDIFKFSQNDCSISNVEIKQVYGNVILLDGATGFHLDSCNIHHFGQASNVISSGTVVTGSIIEYNTVHTGQQLWRYELRPAGWGGGISFSAGHCYDNIVRYNLVYDIYGEGIINPGGITEYNVVGDTYAPAIYGAPHAPIDTHDTTIRYNYIISSNSATYRVLDGRTAYNGIGIIDERDDEAGSNSNADIEIYGNIVINRYYGIYAKNANVATNDAFKLIKIYNNLVIDCDLANYNVSNPEGFTNGYIYNNSSILYDRTGSDHDGANASLPHANWTVSNNAFWTTGGSPTVDDGWDDNDVETDPKLYGEETTGVDWDGQSGATYFSDITFADVTPDSDSGLIGTGKTDTGFEATLLSQGTDFSVLPDTQTFVFQEASHNSLWDIGAIIADYVASTISGAGPSGEQTCTSDPRNVTKFWTTNSTALVGDNCRISLVNEGYVAMGAGKVADTTDSTSHSNTDSEACDAAYTYYVDCSDHAGNITGQSPITYSIESGDPPDPGPGTVGTISGGGCSGGSM